MTRTLRASLLLTLVAFICSADNPTYTAYQSAPAAQNTGFDDGKVYRENAVDVKAKSSGADLELKNFDAVRSGCPSDRTLLVRLRLVLSRTGKVTDVKVLKEEPKCGLADALTKDVRLMPFTPAVRGGEAVSVYRELQIKLNPKKK